MIKNIIFDVGDVLIEYRWKQMLVDFGCNETDAERIGREMFDDPEDSDAIRWFISHGEYMHVPRPSVWKRVHELKEKGYGIYLLSNYPESLFKKHTEYADFMKDIDGMMVSYMIHKGKPERDIYEALCDKYRLDRSECVFFDDRQENVSGAIQCGIKAELVTSKEGLLELLKEY